MTIEPELYRHLPDDKQNQLLDLCQKVTFETIHTDGFIQLERKRSKKNRSGKRNIIEGVVARVYKKLRRGVKSDFMGFIPITTRLDNLNFTTADNAITEKILPNLPSKKS